jgi:hypothetical protein
VTAPAEISGLSNAELQQLVLKLLGENTEQKRAIVELREEIARLKGLKGRPDIKPSGMEQGTTPERRDMRAGRRGRGKVTPWVSVEETLLSLEVPPGSRFKGYEDFVVQDVVLRVRTIRYRRERWVTPDGRTVIAPLPPGVTGHFGPELRRFVLAQYHQGQVTVPRLVEQLDDRRCHFEAAGDAAADRWAGRIPRGGAGCVACRVADRQLDHRGRYRRTA